LFWNVILLVLLGAAALAAYFGFPTPTLVGGSQGAKVCFDFHFEFDERLLSSTIQFKDGAGVASTPAALELAGSLGESSLRNILKQMNLAKSKGCLAICYQGFERPYLVTSLDAKITEPDISVFMASAASGNLDRLRELLGSGVPVDLRDLPGGRTALIWATAGNQPHAVKDLLTAGANPETPDAEGQVALIYATSLARPRIVSILLAAGANPDAKDNRGTTSLMWSAKEGHSEILAELLRSGANPNATDLARRTALMGAAQAGKLEAVKALLSKGADPALRDSSGLTAAEIAERQGHAEVAGTLRQAMRTPARRP
jgi:ankyrin repeat protein